MTGEQHKVFLDALPEVVLEDSEELRIKLLQLKDLGLQAIKRALTPESK